jgi:hypothetical protein
MMVENQHLKKLLMIHDNHGVFEVDIEEGIKEAEKLLQHSPGSSTKKKRQD